MPFRKLFVAVAVAVTVAPLFLAGACSSGRAESSGLVSTGTSFGAPTGSSSGGGGDGSGLVAASEWVAGLLPSPLPSVTTLLALPGGGTGRPVFTSSNPLAFEGDGLLYGSAGPSPTRGGKAVPLSGDFGVWFRHENAAKTAKFVTLLVRNAAPEGITTALEGSGYTQTEAGGLGLQVSPDFRVSSDWLTEAYATHEEPTALAPGQARILWQKVLKVGAEVDARFAVYTTGSVQMFLVVTSGPTLAEVLQATESAAPGTIGDPQSEAVVFGTTAGVYANDTWAGELRVEVPPKGRHVGLLVNSSLGNAHPQVQAFQALGHYDDSASEAVGMHGNVYALEVEFAHDGTDAAPRHVVVSLGSLSDGSFTSDWDGLLLVDGKSVPVTLTPKARRVALVELTLLSGETRTVRLRAMVPGMATYPAGLFFESR